MDEAGALGNDPRGFPQQRAQSPLAAHGVAANSPQRPERQQVAEILVGVGEHVLDDRLLGWTEHAELHEPPPRLEQVVPAQHARTPLGEVCPGQVELGHPVSVAPRPAAAHLALEHHHQIRVEAQHPVEALGAVDVGDLLGDLERLDVRRQEDAHEPPALHLTAGEVFLGGVDDVCGLHVHDAVGQLALGGLADRLQQRLAGEGNEPQHDHGGARELILVTARELEVGLEHVQVRIQGGALHDPHRLRRLSPCSAMALVPGSSHETPS